MVDTLELAMVHGKKLIRIIISKKYPELLSKNEPGAIVYAKFSVISFANSPRPIPKNRHIPMPIFRSDPGWGIYLFTF